MRRASLTLALPAPLFLIAAAAHAAGGPSFDCAHAKSRVNQMICASPELSARDREVAAHYRVLAAQPGTDLPALQRDEAAWLRDVRDPCPDAACVAEAYVVRDAVLQARIRRGAVVAASTPAPPASSPAPAARPPAPVAVAPAPAPARESVVEPAPEPVRPAPRRVSGPAADAEIQPFKVDAGLLAAARSLRGQKCAPGEDVPREPGFLPVPNEWPVVGVDSVVLVRRLADVDFAFLLDTRRGTCRMVDVVALPPHAQAGNLLQCAVAQGDAAKAPLSRGVGLRRPDDGPPLAYWEIDLAHGQLVRQPLAALGWTAALQCRQPQFGD